LNTLAAAPSSFDGDSCVQGMRLSWDGAVDDETALHGLYYCLRVGRDPGEDDVFSGTDSTPLMGNVYQAYEWMLDVPVGRYFWQVRAIDAGLMHSDWSEIQEYIYCPGDLDGDGDVDLADLAALLANYGATGVVYEQGDLDCDGDVDLADLAALLSVYGDDCLQDTLTIRIFTDNYASETTWDLYEQGGGLIASGNPDQNNTLFTWDVTVDSGKCYDFTIHDSYGDGICCAYGDGYYEIDLNGEQVAANYNFTGASDTVAVGGGCP